MSRQLRIQFPGGTYHVTCRGNERRPTFYSDVDRIHFLELLGDAVDRFQWILTAYVLMSNHFHFVMELTSENLSRGMHWLNLKYAQWFNRSHKRVGHLFQGRPDIRLVDKENYLLRVLRYNVLNPVRAHMVRSPADYEWSSYRATAGLTAPPSWLATDDVLSLFGRERAVAQWEYRKFVSGGLTDSPWDDLVGDLYLGKDPWLSEVRDRVEGKPRPDAHTIAQRTVGQERTMTDVVTSVSDGLTMNADWIRTGHGGMARLLSAWMGRYEADLTLAQIAAGLRVRSASNVSEMIRRCDQMLGRDKNLRDDLDRCREALYTTWKTARPQM
jgi:putative transposase